MSVKQALEWLPFWTSVSADALKLGQELYRIFQGDPDAARQHLREMTLDLSKRAAGELDIDNRLAAVQKREEAEKLAREQGEQRGETEEDEEDADKPASDRE